MSEQALSAKPQHIFRKRWRISFKNRRAANVSNHVESNEADATLSLGLVGPLRTVEHRPLQASDCHRYWHLWRLYWEINCYPSHGRRFPIFDYVRWFKHHCANYSFNKYCLSTMPSRIHWSIPPSERLIMISIVKASRLVSGFIRYSGTSHGKAIGLVNETIFGSSLTAFGALDVESGY